MGLVRMGPPEELIELLINNYEIPTFIETGTYRGYTSVWASENFSTVMTVEYAEAIYKETSQKYGHIENIEFQFGDSRAFLNDIAPNLEESAVFWLDGHWSGGDTYGSDDPCPLLDELQAINRSPIEHYILIDDARQFLSPPPEPHSIQDWATIKDVIDILTKEHAYYVTIHEDVIIAVPPSAKELVSTYLQKQNTIEWRRLGEENRKNAQQSGSVLIKRGVKSILKEWRQVGKKIIGR